MNNRVLDIKTNKMFKLGDIFVAVIVLLILIVSIVLLCMPRGESAKIYLNNSLVKELSLSKDASFRLVEGDVDMTFEVSDGKIYVLESNCKDHICEKSKAYRSGDRIVCLPNKVVVVISGDSGVDAVV